MSEGTDDGQEGTPADPPEHIAPELRVVPNTSDVPSQGRPGAPKRISRELYDAMAETYLRGNRSAAELARTLNIHRRTAVKVINEGYPDRGWPALRERALLWDKAKRDEETKAHAAQAKAAIDGRSNARREREQILRLGKAGYATLFQKWQQEAARATFGPPGKLSVNGVEVPTISAHSHVLSGVRLMQGWAVFADQEERQLTDASGQDPSLPAGMPPGLASLTPAQLQYVIDHGSLPPDVSEEAVLGIQPTAR